jgi:hypothetical protein
VDCSASERLYAAADGAFGGGGAGGEELQCPAPGQSQGCQGAVSNCWSPGHRDTGRPLCSLAYIILFPDCPNNGLCCFDGCADRCADGPQPEQPVEAESSPVTEGYNYPVPEVPFELPAPRRPPPGLPTLYGAPPL